MDDFEPKCVGGCGREFNEIEEYIESAKEENMTIEDYIKNEEGTYNPSNGHFYCTRCYIKLGMPLGKAR